MMTYDNFMIYMINPDINLEKAMGEVTEYKRSCRHSMADLQEKLKVSAKDDTEKESSDNFIDIDSKVYAELTFTLR